ISGPLARKQSTDSHKAVSKNKDTSPRRTASPEWQPAEYSPSPGEPLPQLSHATHTTSGPLGNTTQAGTQRAPRRNYQALVAALQTVGHSLTSFIAAAVVSLNGQPIAQVAVDDLD